MAPRLCNRPTQLSAARRPVIQRKCCSTDACSCATANDDRDLNPTATQLLALQRRAGNGAVAGLLRKATVQRRFWDDLVEGASGLAGAATDAARENLTAVV